MATWRSAALASGLTSISIGSPIAYTAKKTARETMSRTKALWRRRLTMKRVKGGSCEGQDGRLPSTEKAAESHVYADEGSGSTKHPTRYLDIAEHRCVGGSTRLHGGCHRERVDRFRQFYFLGLTPVARVY